MLTTTWMKVIVKPMQILGIVYKLQCQQIQKKRMQGGSTVPRLIENKRKYLERNLSAPQRDQLFMKEMKNDDEFRKDRLKL